MNTVLQKALNLLVGDDSSFENIAKKPKKRPLKGLTERELIQLESDIGKELFGPIPADHRREFFNLDPSTWIWYEEWVDIETGKKQSTTTRYEVSGDKILKAQDGASYKYIEGEELRNLTVAVQMYYERVMREVYHRDPQTGKPLPRA